MHSSNYYLMHRFVHSSTHLYVHPNPDTNLSIQPQTHLAVHWLIDYSLLSYNVKHGPYYCFCHFTRLYRHCGKTCYMFRPGKLSTFHNYQKWYLMVRMWITLSNIEMCSCASHTICPEFPYSTYTQMQNADLSSPESLEIWPHHEHHPSLTAPTQCKNTPKLPPFSNRNGFICLHVRSYSLFHVSGSLALRNPPPPPGPQTPV